MESFNIKSKSKLNLFLEVGALRNDGYHEIHTIMVKTDLGDYINITLEKSRRLGINLSCSDKNIPNDENNTIFKVIRELNGIKPIPYEIDIHLNKIVPSKAGLGGASGDAAAVALLLNKYLNGYYEMNELVEAGKNVGADIPFFFFPGIAEVTGIGDKLVRQFDNFDINFVIAKFKYIDIDTAYAYRSIKNDLTKSKENIILIRNSIFNKDIRLMASALSNDFENLVFEQYKDLLSLKNKMMEVGALGACLTGSGSAIFGIVENKEQALMIKERIASPDLEVFACKSTV
ncbi:4-(cytidine 5'-diphospho)-2-C-methyl-D-erythritol kinase [candidate division TA06 bacterium]|uniref:4-diphosphocytidyl-2-C-methyl-D-erythritol kinase n=1 Tax=candidate division TA06 bacterium TaxID=2250710 RepID=A0A660S986_UNCT6|nr:MAG: 4-(cytidine 5'-diphospho)-2-C-methyl-D-erythritol kinase [candidate division TA06 bacterium]